MPNKHITDIVQVLTKNGNPEITTQVHIKTIKKCIESKKC